MRPLPIDVSGETVFPEDRAQLAPLRFGAAIQGPAVVVDGRFAQIAVSLQRKELIHQGASHLQQAVEHAPLHLAQRNALGGGVIHEPVQFLDHHGQLVALVGDSILCDAHAGLLARACLGTSYTSPASQGGHFPETPSPKTARGGSYAPKLSAWRNYPAPSLPCGTRCCRN